MIFQGSSKAYKRPKTLSLGGASQPISKHSSRTTDSIALHDAAVQSATSLMAVMSDMLRSPPLSAHIFGPDNSDRLKPMPSRPRSHTAPPTPLVEAPTVEPAELPGSFPKEKEPYLPLYQSDDRKNRDAFVCSPTRASLGAPIIRPHSSPQEATYRVPDYPNGPRIRVSPKAKLASPAQQYPSANQHLNIGISLPNDSGEDTLVAHEKDNLTLITKRPTLTTLPSETLGSSSLPPSAPSSRQGSKTAVPRLNQQQSSLINLGAVATSRL